MIRQVLKFAMTLSIIARILLTCLLNSFSQSRSSRPCGFLIGVIIPLPTYPLSAIQSAGSKVRRTPDSLRQWLSCRLPSMGSEIHASFSARVQATWTFRPVVLCLPEYSSGGAAHDQHGSRVPSTRYWHRSSRSSAVGTYGASTFLMSRVIDDIARLTVDWENPYVSASSSGARLRRRYVRVTTTELNSPADGGHFLSSGPVPAEWIRAQSSTISSLESPVVSYTEGSLLVGWFRHPNPFEKRASIHVGAPTGRSLLHAIIRSLE